MRLFYDMRRSAVSASGSENLKETFWLTDLDYFISFYIWKTWQIKKLHYSNFYTMELGKKKFDTYFRQTWFISDNSELKASWLKQTS